MEKINALPLWQIRFDRDGNIDAASEKELRAGLRTQDVTDLLIFSHGWNNNAEKAGILYKKFFSLVPPLLAGGDASRRVGLLGVYWPSMRWTDEADPDFDTSALPDLAAGDGGGIAAFGAQMAHEPPPPPDDGTRDAMLEAFPDADSAKVDELVQLLRERPDRSDALDRAFGLISELSASGAGGASDDDGEGAEAAPPAVDPGRDPQATFETFQVALEDEGVVTSDGDAAASILGTGVRRLWHGAQELARQATYWQMKKRAGTVGTAGLGEFLKGLHGDFPQLRINLIGHSFGARLVSFALSALPEDSGIRSVTLLQGAFSHYAFAASLPHDTDRAGALSGVKTRVEGPVVACFSKYDMAVGTFYPLASLTAGQDAADVAVMQRWGAIGHDGHQPKEGTAPVRLQKPHNSYDFGNAKLINIDARTVVRRGRPPTGAHSDICHPELAWVIVSAAGLR